MFDAKPQSGSMSSEPFSESSSKPEARPDPEKLRQMIAAGMSDSRCGEHFGLSKYAIRRLRRRWGIEACLNKPRSDISRINPRRFRWREGNLGEDFIADLYGARSYRLSQTAAQKH